MTAPARYQPLAPTAAVSRTDLSQATAIEQSRAVAEVQAAVLVAQQRPRNKALAVEEMRDATAQTSVAEKAYYRYRRGSENVTGVSIHLARELARCWGNLDYGLKELRRDDTKGESEMLAHAWDMQTNARASTTFIVPHVRDTKQGARKLTETRDIYENNANAGARRLREQILAILPNWFVEEAKSNCDATIESGGGRPLAQRVADAIRLFDQLGVTTAQLEAKLGRSANDWSGHDVGQLGVIYQSIKRSETTIDNEFDTTPADTGITVEDVTKAGRARRAPAEPASNSGAEPDNSQSAAPGEPEQPAAENDAEPPGEAEPMATQAQVRKLNVLLDQLGATERADKLHYLGEQFKRAFASSKELTKREASELIDFLENPPAESDQAEQLPIEGEGGDQ
ncbi:hypothetical protein [Nocardia sp. N2S4-5]|uniref:hypothetical protein n=1 Tax=Nocardia sp. N2S4-5 TaxID=3351565 RepID=UPI0037D83DEB